MQYYQVLHAILKRLIAAIHTGLAKLNLVH